MINFYEAVADHDYVATKILFEAYAASIHINLDFQHFEDELVGLNAMYARPYGGIILAKEQDEVIGCVGIRKISEEVGELKRMYIQPEHQNRGMGNTLLGMALQLAKECKYDVVKLDTLNHMLPAIHLYKKAGFYETPPYYHNPLSTAVYFEKVL